ncbi:ATP-binding protein [Lentzea sp. NPDC003310]|uniref:ATP-binding protein n=1 Tax=Lentzea sp. NPDC003310 TaxID=3154447 RepID=UPI00339F3E88
MPEHFLRLAGATTMPTEEVQLVEQDVRDLVRYQGLGVVHGRAGVGKTFAVQWCLERLDPVTTDTARGGPLRVVQVVFTHAPTALEVAKELARAVLVDPPRNANRYRLQNLVLERVTGRPHLLVVDEAQRLTRHTMEVLRYLWDHKPSQLAVLLVGGDGCREVVAREPMMESRVFRTRHLQPLPGRRVPELIRRYHSLYHRAEADLIARVDAEFAHGIWRNWASFTLTAAELAAEHDRDTLDAELVDNTYLRLGAASLPG